MEGNHGSDVKLRPPQRELDGCDSENEIPLEELKLRLAQAPHEEERDEEDLSLSWMQARLHDRGLSKERRAQLKPEEVNAKAPSPQGPDL